MMWEAAVDVLLFEARSSVALAMKSGAAMLEMFEMMRNI